MNPTIASAVKKLFGILGLEVRRQRPPASARTTFAGVLRQFSTLGFQPRTVIDVGVAFETEDLYQAFRDAEILLIEPLVEFKPFLKGICERYKAQYALAAAGAARGSAIINVRADQLECSSLFKETEGPTVDGTPREVPVVTIDDLCRERALKGPYLIKIDVQGAELKVLAGATQTLKQTEVVILEVSLLGMLIEAPQVLDVMTYMKDRGFVPYDVWGLLYRPYDGALAQMDMAFVRADGPFRASHVYATPDQRRQIASRLERPAQSLLSGASPRAAGKAG